MYVVLIYINIFNDWDDKYIYIYRWYKEDLYQGPEDGFTNNKYKAPDVIGDVVDICKYIME